MPRLTPALRETALAWMERNPLNVFAKPRDVFPGKERENTYHRARCAGLIARGALVPDRPDINARRWRYRLADWALAEILNP